MHIEAMRLVVVTGVRHLGWCLRLVHNLTNWVRAVRTMMDLIDLAVWQRLMSWSRFFNISSMFAGLEASSWLLSIHLRASWNTRASGSAECGSPSVCIMTLHLSHTVSLVQPSFAHPSSLHMLCMGSWGVRELVGHAKRCVHAPFPFPGPHSPALQACTRRVRAPGVSVS